MLRAGDNLRQLLCNGALARSVVAQAEILDHLAGVLRGRIHRHAARGLLAGKGITRGGVDQSRQVLRQEFLQQRVGVRLAQHLAAGALRRVVGVQRQKRLQLCLLRQHRHERRIRQHDLVILAAVIGVQHMLADFGAGFEGQPFYLLD